MSKLKAVIIDDEASSRQSLSKKIALHCADVEIIAECENGEQGMMAIEEKKPDIVFLDVEMPRMNGFTMLQHLSNRSFELIFTTAYDHYAIRAIKFSALDYLVKPIEVEDLKTAIEMVKQKRKQSTTNENQLRFIISLQNNLKSTIKIPVDLVDAPINSIPLDIAYEIEYCHNHSSLQRIFEKPLSELMI